MKPNIVVLSRNSEDTKLFHKAFMERHPELKWIPFENLANTPRAEFARKVGESAVGVMLDRRATYGTFPMECATSHTYPVCLDSNFDIPYTESNGDNSFVFLSDRIVDIPRQYQEDGKERFYDIVEAVYRQVMLYLDGEDSTKYFEGIVKNNRLAFDCEEKRQAIVSVYEKIILERRTDIEAQKKQMEENKDKDE